MPAKQLLPILRQDSQAFISAYYVGNSVPVILVYNLIDSLRVYQLSPLTDQSEEILRLLDASSFVLVPIVVPISYRISDTDSSGKKLIMFQKNGSKRRSFQGTELLKA
jgi:urea transporter